MSLNLPHLDRGGRFFSVMEAQSPGYAGACETLQKDDLMTPYRVQHIAGKPTVLDENGHEIPGALVLKITYGHEPLTDLEGTTVILNGHNEATIVVNRQKYYDVPVIS